MKEDSLVQKLVAKPEFGPLVLLLGEIAVFWTINPTFLSLGNISNTLTYNIGTD